MTICTKFQPMGYSPNRNSENIRQILTAGQISSASNFPSVFVLDKEGVVWVYGIPFYMSYTPTWANIADKTKFTRVFRNVKKICHHIGGGDYGSFLFITKDDKLYFWGKEKYVTSTSTSSGYFADNSAYYSELMTNVKDAWVLRRCDNNDHKLTFYALTKDYKLYARGNNDGNVFGDGGTSSSTQDWVLIQENVAKFFITKNNNYGYTLVIETTDHSVKIANLSVTAGYFGQSWFDTYTSFTKATEPPSAWSDGELAGVDYVIHGCYFKYNLTGTNINPSTVTIASIGIVYAGAVWTNWGCGWKKYNLVGEYIKGMIDIPYGFAFADDEGLKYWVTQGNKPPFPQYTPSGSGTGFNYSETQQITPYPIQTKNSASIKTLMTSVDNTCHAYITADDKLYLGMGDGSLSGYEFGKIDENVYCVGEGLRNRWAWATRNGKLFSKVHGLYAGDNAKNELPALDPTNTSWQN